MIRDGGTRLHARGVLSRPVRPSAGAGRAPAGRAAWAAAALLAGSVLLPSGPAACRRAPTSLTLSLPYDLDGLEPGARDRLSDFAVLSNLYEPLVTTDPGLGTRPCLAERWTNPEVTRWVFHLRPGVRFHDGRPLTAADVVASFRRLLEKPAALEAARHILTIESVRALSARDVEIRTRTPMADFLNRVRFIHVVPASASGEDLRRRAVGTGPYRLRDYRPGVSLTLERNEDYWGPAPDLERAVLLLGRMPADALADLLSGRSGFVQSNSRDAVVAGGQPGFVVRKVSSIAVKFLVLDIGSARSPHVSGGINPFRDRRVREAIHVGLDRAALVEELPAPALPTFQLVPPFIFGYSPALPRPEPDRARARALLADAGWPDGFAVTLHARRLLGDAVGPLRTALGQIGIRVDARLLADPEFFAQTREGGGFALGLTRFGCPTGDAANFFDAGLHSRDRAGGWGRSNFGGYASPEVDRLLELATRTLLPEERRPLLERVMAIALTDLPWIPLYVDEDVYVHRAGFSWEPRLDNYVIVSELKTR